MAITNYTNINPSSGNQGYTGNPNQEWLNRKVQENNEATLVFKGFGDRPATIDGYATHSFYRVSKVGAEMISEVLNATTDPDSVDITIGTISVTPRQFGITGTIKDTVLKFNVMDALEKMGIQFGRAIGRHCDELVQDVLYDYATENAGRITKMVRFAGNVTQVNGFTGSNTASTQMKLSAVSRLSSLFRSRSVGTWGEKGYALIMANEVVEALRTSSSNDSITWQDIFKHTPEGQTRISRGELGMVFGVTLIENEHIKSKTGATSSVTVFPSYLIAPGAYGCLDWEMNTYYIPPSQVDSNNKLGMFGHVGVKYTFNAVVLNDENYMVYLSQAPAL